MIRIGRVMTKTYGNTLVLRQAGEHDILITSQHLQHVQLSTNGLVPVMKCESLAELQQAAHNTISVRMKIPIEVKNWLKTCLKPGKYSHENKNISASKPSDDCCTGTRNGHCLLQHWFPMHHGLSTVKPCELLFRTLGNLGYPSETHMKHKSRDFSFAHYLFAVAYAFWNLHIARQWYWQRRWMLWTNVISWVPDGYSILHSPMAKQAGASLCNIWLMLKSYTSIKSKLRTRKLHLLVYTYLEPLGHHACHNLDGLSLVHWMPAWYRHPKGIFRPHETGLLQLAQAVPAWRQKCSIISTYDLFNSASWPLVLSTIDVYSFTNVFLWGDWFMNSPIKSSLFKGSYHPIKDLVCGPKFPIMHYVDFPVKWR